MRSFAMYEQRIEELEAQNSALQASNNKLLERSRAAEWALDKISSEVLHGDRLIVHATTNKKTGELTAHMQVHPPHDFSPSTSDPLGQYCKRCGVYEVDAMTTSATKCIVEDKNHGA